MKTKPFREAFFGNIEISIKTAVDILSAYPVSGAAFLRLSKKLTKARRVREEQLEKGINVPPLMIVSTTEQCNLACAGCYSCAGRRSAKTELSDARIFEIFEESSELGISIILLAGGEPLLSHGWLEALASHPELLGIVFTNGTLFDDSHLAWFSKYRHIFPVFSLEGGERATDSRRGQGVYRKVNGAMTGLKKAGVPFGVSVTATNENLEEILSTRFIEEYISKGCRLFIYPEYVPVETGSEPLVLSKKQKQRLNEFAQKSAKEYPALLIPFPGDEEQYGGCLAAGRGFIHISSSGAVEPCPFAPFSDSSLQTSSLAQALNSKLLAKVRAHHQLLKEGEGGCALWSNRAWFLSAEEDTLTATTL